MGTAVCRLGGILVTAESPVPWAVTTGVAPFTATYSVHEKEWPKLQARLGEEMDLTITANGTPVRTIKGVYPLREIQSTKPFLRFFLVADRRWKWGRRVVVRDFNISRKSGDKALLGPTPTQVPIELAQSVDQYRYLPITLQNETTRWTARKALETVLERVDPGAWDIDSLSIQADGKTGAMSLQNLMLRDGGDAAIARALADIPGTAVKVEEDGRVHAFDATDVGAAGAVLDKAGKPTVLGDIVRLIDYRALRPSYVDVYFVREVEFRFDFNEETETRYAHETNDMYCDNVLPLPDPITTVNGRRLAMGTWVTVREALTAWEADRQGKETLPYSFDTVRLHYFTGDLAMVWGGAPTSPTDLSATSNAFARAQAVMQHYRQTFRINRKYVDRMRDLRNVRVVILDTTTGARAPALTWSQYCIETSQKAQVLITQRGNANGVPQYWLVNVDKYPGINGELHDPNTAPSQASLSIVDADLGVVRITYLPSPYGLGQAAFPCNVGDEQGNVVPPTRDLTKQDADLISVGGRVGPAGKCMSLAASYKMALVISAQVAAPNNERQCHRQRVAPADLNPFLRSRFTAGVAAGPPQQVFVPPQQSTARFGWAQTAAARASMLSLLGLNSSDPTKSGLPAETTTIPGFLWQNEQEVQEVARSAAAEVYASYVDAPEGRHVTHERAVEVKGNIGSATRNLAPDGRLTTTVDFSSSRPAVSRFAYLSDPVRQIVLRIIPS